MALRKFNGKGWRDTCFQTLSSPLAKFVLPQKTSDLIAEESSERSDEDGVERHPDQGVKDAGEPPVVRLGRLVAITYIQ